MVSFEAVADEYDEGRPAYPAGVFVALEPLAGLRVLDVGAGTGLASGQLAERGAEVVALDPGLSLLRHARRRNPEIPVVVGTAERLPFRSAQFDLVCFAQSWHWVDAASGATEASRVLRRGGRWAGWWSHARADASGWFDAYWSTIEDACPGTHRTQRDIDWGRTLDGDAGLAVRPRVTVPWTRRTTVDDWMVDQRSHSYIAALTADPHEHLLQHLRHVLDDEFPSGEMLVPYETWVWIADDAR